MSFRSRREPVAARGRCLRRNGVPVSGIPPLAGRNRVRRFARLQSVQMDDGPFRLHCHVGEEFRRSPSHFQRRTPLFEARELR